MTVVDIIFNWISTILLVLKYGWPFILLVILIVFKIKWKNWPIDVVLIERRGNNLIKSNDRAGKFIDPYTGITGYKLLKNNDTIPVINFEWLLVNNNKFTTIFDRLVHLLRDTSGTMFFFKYGTKQYKPINIKRNNEVKTILKEIRDSNNQPILIQVYEQFDPRKVLGGLKFETIDWDNMNFMVQEQRATFERRKKKGEFLKSILIPLGMALIVGLVCIIMIKFSYDYALAMKGGGGQPQDTTATKPNIPIVSDLVPGT